MYITKVLSILNDRISDLSLNKPEHWQIKMDEVNLLKLIFKDRLK